MQLSPSPEVWGPEHQCLPPLWHGVLPSRSLLILPGAGEGRLPHLSTDVGPIPSGDARADTLK